MPPLNLVGDFGGGGMLLAYGMVCGIFEATKSNQGQVIDAAMVDGTAALMAMFYSMSASGVFDIAARHQHARRRRTLLRHLRNGRW